MAINPVELGLFTITYPGFNPITVAAYDTTQARAIFEEWVFGKYGISAVTTKTTIERRSDHPNRVIAYS